MITPDYKNGYHYDTRGSKTCATRNANISLVGVTATIIGSLLYAAPIAVYFLYQGITMTPTNWLNAVWESDLTSQQKLLACFLRKHLHGNKLMCFPSKTRMVAETGLTKKTVRKHINLLEDLGWISIERSNGGRNNRYTIQGKNVTGSNSTLVRGENNPSNRGDKTPLKSNIKNNKKYNSKKDVFTRLTDTSWAGGLVK